MKIGVSGASGHLGGTLLSELFTRAEGAEIIGVSRTPENVAAPAQGRFGDYDKSESLSDAYAGLDALVLIPSADVREGVRARSRPNGAAASAASWRPLRSRPRHREWAAAELTRAPLCRRSRMRTSRCGRRRCAKCAS